MKAVCKKLFSLMLVAILLVSAVPFQASAEEVAETAAPTEAAVVETEAAVVETTAPVVAPVVEVVETEPVQQEVNVNTPAANGEVVKKDDCYVEFEVAIPEVGTYRVSVTKTKIGSGVNTPGESKVMEVVKKVTGSSAGYKLIKWTWGEANTFYSGGTVSEMMYNSADGDLSDDEKYDSTLEVIRITAQIEYVAKDIALKLDGGSCSVKSHTVMIGQQYDYFGKLPTPTKANSDFLGWAKADGTIVGNGETVTDLSALTAKWSSSRYDVTFQAYSDVTGTDASGWADVDAYKFTGDYAVKAKSVLNVSEGYFPTDSDVKSMFLGELAANGWSIDGWEYSADGANWKTFTAGKTKVEADIFVRPIYKKTITLVADDYGNNTRTLTVTLGKAIPALPHPGTRGTREGQAFVHWYAENKDDVIVTKANLSNTSVHPAYYPGFGNLKAYWEAARTVYLYIHTNGNTKEHTKLVKYYDVPKSGMDLTTINLADIFPNYGKYDDKGDEKHGWYDPYQWANYVQYKHEDDTIESFDDTYMDTDDVLEFYIMLVDNGNNTSSSASNGVGYNDNKTTVDSSNPSTGDDIFVAVTVMAVSACALLLFFMNKKRIAK